MIERAKALAATGPRTIEGKARSSQNATKHGIFAVVMPHEADAYAAHLAALQWDLRPVGYLEDMLVDRVALTLWRLGRVAKHETAAAAIQVHNVFDQSMAYPVALRGQVKDIIDRWGLPGAESGLGLQEAIVTLADRRTESARLAQACYGAAELVQSEIEVAIGTWPAADIQRIAGIAVEELPEGANASKWRPLFLGGRGSSLPKILQLLRALGRARHLPGEPALLAGLRHIGLILSSEARQLSDDHERLQALAIGMIGQAVLPQDRTVEKIAKYEAHLERALYRALHELEALQDRRHGRLTPLARLDVNGPA